MSSSHEHMSFGMEVDVSATSLVRGTAIADVHIMSFPTQGEIDRQYNYPSRKGTLDLVQRGEVAERKCNDKLGQPNTPSFPTTEHLLTKKSTPSASSLSDRSREGEFPTLGASMQAENREKILSRTILGLCMSPNCPIQHVHYAGISLPKLPNSLSRSLRSQQSAAFRMGSVLPIAGAKRET